MNDDNPSPPVEIPLNTYLAIQTRAGEHPAHPVHAFCETAKMLKVLFRRAETLDIIQVGGRLFVRVRTDLDRTRARQVLQKLAEVTHRGVVYLTDGGKYEVLFQDHRQAGVVAPVSSVLLHSVPRGPQALYRGPKIKGWEKQFAS